MTDKEKTITELKEVLDSLDITNEYRLNLIKAIEYLQEEHVRKEFEMALVEMIDNAQKNVIEPWVVAAQWKDELIELAKSEEPVSEELEEELKNWRHNHFHGRRDMDATGEYLVRSSQLDIAHHFAQWQKQQTVNKTCNFLVDAGKYMRYNAIEDCYSFDAKQLVDDFKDYIEEKVKEG